MKKVLLLVFLCISLFANEAEKLFWDEVKNSNDVEMLQLYKKQYPHGIFIPLCNLKLKRLEKIEKPKRDKNGIPIWLKGARGYYKYYGIGRANVHSKGIYYQENQARSRAKQELFEKFNKARLSNEEIFNYAAKIKTDKYVDNRGRIYILVYIDNYDL